MSGTDKVPRKSSKSAQARSTTTVDRAADDVGATKNAAGDTAGSASCNVFLEPSGNETVAARAERIVAAAARSCGLEPGSVRIGKISELAQSFSISASKNVISAIEADDEVKALLRPQDTADIYPKPTKSRDVDG